MFFKTFTLTLALTFIVLSKSNSQDYVTENLIGYWSMDIDAIEGNIVKDISGRENHGTIIGDPQVVKGKIGEALTFNGVDDYITLPDMGIHPQVTVEIWASLDDRSGRFGLVSNPTVVGEIPEAIIYFSISHDGIFLSLLHNTVSSGLASHSMFVGEAVKTHKWHHLVYTSNPRSTIGDLEYYFDGCCDRQWLEKFEDNNRVDAPLISLSHLKIGSSHNSGYFAGRLDEVRIYNRALTFDEIRQNFEYQSNAIAVDTKDKLAVTWGALKTLNDKH